MYRPLQGTTITLTCIVTSGTATQIRWFHNDQALIMFGESRYSGGIVGTPSLTIRNVRIPDNGMYICQGSDGVATKNTTAINLLVNAKPLLPVLTGPQTLIAGQSGNWKCTSQGGYPQPALSMRIEDTGFSEQLSISNVVDQTARTYTVTGIVTWSPSMANDQQRIYCDVSHPQTLSSVQTVSLLLTVKSPLGVDVRNTYYNPEEESDVILHCSVTSGTATEITWYKGISPITIAEEYEGATVLYPSLTIRNIKMEHSGNYYCEASDDYTTVRSEMVVLQTKELPATEFRIITTILKGYNKLVRPRDPVVNVSHSLVPQHIHLFDQKRLVLNGMQCMSWNDPRLSWVKGQPRVSLPSSVIWIPDIVLYGHKFIHHDESKVIVMKDGTVTYCPQGHITTTDCSEKSGEMFECTFKFVSWSYDLVMLDKTFPVLKPSVDLSVYEAHRKYEISTTCARRNEVTYPCRTGTYPQLTYTFMIRRIRSSCTNLSGNPTCTTFSNNWP